MAEKTHTKPVLRCAVAGALMLGSSTAFAAGEGPTIVERWIEDAKAFDFLDMSHQGLSYDEQNDVTTVNGFKAVFTPDFTSLIPEGDDVPQLSYIFEIPKLRYVALSETGDRYQADSIEADLINVTYTLESGEIDLPDDEATGTYSDIVLSAVDWAKLPALIDDPKKPISKYYPLVAALVDVNMASFTAGGSEMTQTLDASTVLKTTYGAMQATGVERGDYALFSIDGIRMFSTPKTDAEAGSSEYELMFDVAGFEGRNYNSGTMVRQFDPALAASQADTPFKTLLGELSATDSRVEFDNTARVKIDEASYADWGVRPPSLPLLALADELYLEAIAGETEPDEETILRMVSSLYSMFRVGSIGMSGFDLQVDEASSDTRFAARLADFKLADLWAGGLGEFSLKGLFAEGDGNRVQLDLFQLRDIGFPTLDALMDAKRASDEMDINAIIAALPTLGLIEAAGVDIQIPDQQGIKLGLNRLEMSDFIGRLPTRVSSTLENLEIDVASLDDEGREVFEKMGYNYLNVSYMLSLVWDEATELLSLVSKNSLVDGGSLDATVDIGSVPRSVFEDPQSAQNALALLSFNAASVVFNDNSIVDRALEATASQQGKSADQLKQEVLGALPFLMGALNNPDFVDEVAEAVSKLLSEGGTITATASPEQPVSVMQVIAGGATAPGTLVDLLEVEVVAD
jgi:hypothetical protein